MYKLLGTIIVISICLLTGCKTPVIQQEKDDIIQDEWKMKAADGVRLYVTEFGTGDTVIVIHGGFGAEHGYLLSAFLPLANKYHFVMYDQRGSLRSRCEDSLITLDKHIDDIERLRTQLGLSQVTLVGHSMGGFLAMSYMKNYPGKVSKLILMDSPPAKCNIEDLTSKLNEPTLARWERPEVIAELRKYGLEEDFNESYTDKQSSTRNRITFGAINLHDVSKWREIKGGPLYYSSKAGAATVMSMKSDSWNFIETFRNQHVPVFILHGDDDYLPYSYHDNWKDSVDALHFTIIKNAGHCVWIDNFDGYKKAIVSALND